MNSLLNICKSVITR